MTTIIFGGGSSFGGGVQSNSPGSPTIQATAGSVTTVTGTINQPINNVSTFSSVQYGISPYTYSISSGTLPTGVTLDSTTGIISGIPTATQSSSSVTVSVTDSLGVTASTTATVAFTVGSAIVATANSVSPVQIIQNSTITNVTPFASVSGGTLPYYYFVSSGTLPERVTLNSTTGLVSGTPTQTYSTASVTFSVRDGGGIVAATTSTVSFTVIAALSATAGATTAVNAIQNTAITSFNPFSSVSGGYTPYVYGIVSGTLPTGVTLNTSTGLVSGTPTTLQSAASVTFKVTDAQGSIATTITTVNFTVNTSISATAGATTTVSVYQNTAITSFNPFSSVSGGYTPYVYGISSGTLPTGITLNTSTGLVSGTPTVIQSLSNVTFIVKDANNLTASTTVTVGFTVTAPSYTINYLVVAGGGGGGGTSTCGYQGGGGGAGGLLAGSVSSVPFGTPFTITVGAGGAGGTAAINGITGTIGTNSSISSPVLTPVTVPGGGGGGGGHNATATGGGSGGGGGNSGGASGLATGSPGYGVAGTYGYPGGGPNGLGYLSGGGGRGGAGLGYPSNGGGPGYTWPFTNNSYAGGGNWGGNPSPGSGGGGGGGGSPGNPPNNGGAGTAGTGGGGGGGGWITAPYSGAGGAGGSGTVILAIPTPNYPGSAPGAIVTTPPAAPGYTVLTYNTPSPTTPGSFTYTA